MNHIIVVTALLPVIICLAYLFYKDRKSSEPPRQLLNAIMYGPLSILLSLCLSIPFRFIGLYPETITSLFDAVRTAFFGAAIPEEMAKLFCLWLVLRKNPYFDEKMDGIVYAVCVSLGFAAVENIMYLFSNAETFMLVGITRALFAIPGHMFFGIMMGYYYSLAKFYPSSSMKNSVLVLLSPILAHGIYDYILMSMSSVSPNIIIVMWLLFLFFCCKMWSYGSARIEELLRRDAESDVN
jgi:RsiW-degrading membrane proteinase PrsW (M82 family)